MSDPSVVALHLSIRKGYKEISAKADTFHLRRYNSLDDGLEYLWFESLADAINDSMLTKQPSAYFLKLCQSLEQAYKYGDPAVKTCIDVAFVENLFWEVPIREAKPYWAVFPRTFQTLYTDFFGRPPITKA
jgi:hypothetical protein